MTGDDQACSIAATLEVVGDRWTVLILRDVFRGVRRFSELRDDLGIASNLLSDRLSRLVGHGVLDRVPYQQRPVRYEYRLTAKGADLSPALIALMRWGDHWYAEGGPPVELVHDRCGTPLEQRPLCPACDQFVSPGHIRSRPGPGRHDPAGPTVAGPTAEDRPSATATADGRTTDGRTTDEPLGAASSGTDQRSPATEPRPHQHRTGSTRATS